MYNIDCGCGGREAIEGSSGNFFGTGQAFLWRVAPQAGTVERYGWERGGGEQFMRITESALAMGGGGTFGTPPQYMIVSLASGLHSRHLGCILLKMPAVSVRTGLWLDAALHEVRRLGLNLLELHLS